MSLRNVPENIPALDNSETTVAASDRGLCSQIIPVFTPWAKKLADYLLQMGYPVVPMTYPVVEERPRIRVVIYARNMEEEIDSFTRELLAASSAIGSASGSIVCAGKIEALEAAGCCRYKVTFLSYMLVNCPVAWGRWSLCWTFTRVATVHMSYGCNQ